MTSLFSPEPLRRQTNERQEELTLYSSNPVGQHPGPGLPSTDCVRMSSRRSLGRCLVSSSSLYTRCRRCRSGFRPSPASGTFHQRSTMTVLWWPGSWGERASRNTRHPATVTCTPRRARQPPHGAAPAGLNPSPSPSRPSPGNETD